MSAHQQGRILVTGGAGFIGSALVWELNRRGFEDILIADSLGRDEKWRNLVPLKFTDFLHADDILLKLEKSAFELGKIKTVFHLGACSSTTEKDADFLLRNNFEFTKNLAEWALSIGARFIYASSAATYGDGTCGMADVDDEIDQLRPLNMYGYSKQMFDQYARRKGFLDRVVGLKYFNVFGPNEDHKGDMRSLVNKAFAQITRSGKLSLFRSHRPDFRDGEQKRDFLYVKDAVRMTLHFLDQPETGGLYNIGSGEANTWITLAEAIFAALKKEPKIEFVDMPEEIREKYQYFTQADISKLRSSGWKEPCRPLADAVSDYVCHYLVPNRRLGESDDTA